MRKRTIQIRSVPTRIYRTLKVRAAHAGMSLSKYVLQQLMQLAEQPTLDDILNRLRTLPSTNVDTAAAVRAERDARK
jgi:hypothetical protein